MSSIPAGTDPPKLIAPVSEQPSGALASRLHQCLSVVVGHSAGGLHRVERLSRSMGRQGKKTPTSAHTLSSAAVRRLSSTSTACPAGCSLVGQASLLVNRQKATGFRRRRKTGAASPDRSRPRSCAGSRLGTSVSNDGAKPQSGQT